MTKEFHTNISQITLQYQRKVKANERPKISSALRAYQLFRANWDDMTINLFEEFKILLLDRNNQCMGIVPIAKGGVSGVTVDPKLIFASALKARACGIILGHNHPSGGLKASSADKAITRKIVQGAHYLDISILDHLIVTDDEYYSMADDNLVSFTL
ncbi:JAB domain-containing protein [uncultured Kordia sp.]|uniref:JAB domain-containing protein n=1 Tax=uncultured Kordia sp. TaxID=507699 RepID=UPI00263452C7|nr:JAB domain-containing protein [uncultured Kordia sp.]